MNFYLRQVDVNIQEGRSQCNAVIEQYFKLGLTQREIILCLLKHHDFSISLRQLKRVLSERRLKRKGTKNRILNQTRVTEPNPELGGKKLLPPLILAVADVGVAETIFSQ